MSTVHTTSASERRLQVGDTVYATFRNGNVIQLMIGKVIGFTPDGICGVKFEDTSSAEPASA